MAGDRRRAFWGVLIIIVGGIWLYNNLGIGPRITWSIAWPLILIAVGLWIILRQSGYFTSGRGRNSYVLDHIFGDVKLEHVAWDLKDMDVNVVIGDVALDLSRARIPDGLTTIRIRSFIGDLDIVVPQGLAVSAVASAAVGALHVLGEKRDGFFQDIAFATPDYDTAAKKVRIEIGLVIGDAAVMRLG